MLLGRKPMGTVAYMGGLPAVLEQFCWSWGQMIQYNEEYLANENSYVHYLRTTFSDHSPARNNLVAAFLGDWLVQMDTDHQFEPDIVARIVQLANKAEVDVVSAVYQLKRHPHVPVIYHWVEIEGQVGLQPIAGWPKDASLIEIGSAGAGCLFVRRSVFERLSKAYPGVGAFEKIFPYSEDHSFFYRCKEQGIKCYAAMKVHSNHLRVVPVTMDDLDADCMLTSEPFQVGGFK